MVASTAKCGVLVVAYLFVRGLVLYCTGCPGRGGGYTVIHALSRGSVVSVAPVPQNASMLRLFYNAARNALQKHFISWSSMGR